MNLVAALLLALQVDVSVDAGAQDRINTPVRRCVVLPESLAQARHVTLKGTDGSTIPGQLTSLGLLDPIFKVPEGQVARGLAFVVPALKAGQTVKYAGTVSAPASAAEEFRWKETPKEHLELSFGSRPVLRYMCAPLDESSKEAREKTYKVFHHLYDPSGKRLVTKGPGGKFTHHRGIFYGFNKVTYGSGKSCDIWHCTGTAFQEHEKVLSVDEGPVMGRHRVQIAWHGANKEVFAREERELTVWNVPGGTLVEFASVLHPVIAPIKLDGDPQHAGFHFRADNEVAEATAKQTWYLRPDGAGKPGETRNWPGNKDHVNLPWNAMSFVVGGSRYTVAYLDRPGNPKEARFSERDYGRFGSYFVHSLEEGKPLTVNYGLWLQEGEMKGSDAAGRSADFVAPPQ